MKMEIAEWVERANPREVNALVAEKVMGWHKEDDIGRGSMPWWCDNDPDMPYCYLLREWNPLHIQDQLWDLLDKFEKWNIMRFPNPDRYCVEIYVTYDEAKARKVYVSDDPDRTLNQAVIIASLEAVGFTPDPETD